MRCLTSGRFSMEATVLRQGVQVDLPSDASDGTYVDEQDPISGDIIRVWQPTVKDDPTTPQDEVKQNAIPCIVRGVVDGGIRVAGTTERFGADFESVDYARMWFPAGYVLSKRDRITQIRDGRTGQIFWVEEELKTQDNKYVATIFNVNGVTPLFDAFNQHIENVALLERAEF